MNGALDSVKGNWNTHFIRRSRHETVSGRPDELFYLPELRSSQDYKKLVTEEQCQYVLENYLDADESDNDYNEYFQYVVDTAGLTSPDNWREALDLYNRLIEIAVGGS